MIYIYEIFDLHLSYGKIGYAHAYCSKHMITGSLYLGRGSVKKWKSSFFLKLETIH